MSLKRCEITKMCTFFAWKFGKQVSLVRIAWDVQKDEWADSKQIVNIPQKVVATKWVKPRERFGMRNFETNKKVL